MNSIAKRPIVSVIIPTYNRSKPTIAAIQSALAQSYRDIEIIIVDDGSTDGTSERVRRFVEQECKDERLCFVQQANQGASAARNTGIQRARGEYVAFLDSDDEWYPEKLELQVETLEELNGECGACFTDARCVDSRGMDVHSFELFSRGYKQRSGVDDNAVISLARSFCGFWVSTLVARTDLVRQVGGFDTNIPFSEDRDFYFRLALATPLAYVNIPLARSDRNVTPPGSDCRPWDKVDVRLAGEQRMYESWLGLAASYPGDVKSAILKQLRATHCGWANWHLENRRYGKAREEVSKAIGYGFALKVAIKWSLIWFVPALARRLSAKTQSYL